MLDAVWRRQVLSSLHKHIRVAHEAHAQYTAAMQQIATIRWQRQQRKSRLMLTCSVCGVSCHGHQLFHHLTEEHGGRPDLAALQAAARVLYSRQSRRFYQRAEPKRHECAHRCGKSFLKGYLRLHEAKCRGGKPAEDADESRVCSQASALRRVRVSRRPVVVRYLQPTSRRVSDVLRCSRSAPGRG